MLGSSGITTTSPPPVVGPCVGGVGSDGGGSDGGTTGGRDSISRRVNVVRWLIENVI